MYIYVYIGQVCEKSMAEKYLFLAAVKPMFAPRNVDVDKFERSLSFILPSKPCLIVQLRHPVLMLYYFSQLWIVGNSCNNMD